ncbi:Uncharacterised protein [Mycobacteroides abscessus]|nr:Uncharacterised protein [Mycobacteroides abscessus]
MRACETVEWLIPSSAASSPTLRPAKYTCSTTCRSWSGSAATASRTTCRSSTDRTCSSGVGASSATWS